MYAYIVRRLLLMVPTLFGIMVINFLIVQVAPGGPVETLLGQIQGMGVGVTERFTGSTTGDVMDSAPALGGVPANTISIGSSPTRRVRTTDAGTVETSTMLTESDR